MDKIFQTWWFSGIVLAILINIISSYFKSSIDKWRAKYSESRRIKLAAQRIKEEELVALLNQSYEERVMLKLRVNEYKIEANHSMVFAFALLASSTYIMDDFKGNNSQLFFMMSLSLAGTFFMFDSIYSRGRAGWLNKLLNRTSSNHW